MRNHDFFSTGLQAAELKTLVFLYPQHTMYVRGYIVLSFHPFICKFARPSVADLLGQVPGPLCYLIYDISVELLMTWTAGSSAWVGPGVDS